MQNTKERRPRVHCGWGGEPLVVYLVREWVFEDFQRGDEFVLKPRVGKEGVVGIEFADEEFDDGAVFFSRHA